MKRTLLVAVLNLLFIATYVQADVLYLEDGSVLYGSVSELEGELKFKPAFGDELALDWSQVVGLSTDDNLAIELKTGQRIEGQFIYSAPAIGAPGQTGKWQIKKSDGSTMAVNSDDMKMIWPAGEEDPVTLKNKTKWTVRLSAGINGETGSNERVNFNAAIDIKRTTPNDELDIYGRARFSQENGSISSNELIAGVEYDWNLTKRLAVFIREEVERDRFENINFRSTTTTGLAYKIFTKDKLKWTVKLGSGAQYEEQIGGIQRTEGVIEASEELMYQYSPYLEFNHKIEFFPEINDFGDNYRAIMENGVIIPLKSDKSWQVRMGLRHSYNKNPGGTSEKLDTFYYANVVWDVK